MYFLEDIRKCIGKTLKISLLLVAFGMIAEIGFPIEIATKRANCLELIWRAKGALETEAKDSVKQAEADSRSDKWSSRGRKRTVILDIPAESEIRPPTWEEAARKCIEVYREVISKHKNCPRRR